MLEELQHPTLLIPDSRSYSPETGSETESILVVFRPASSNTGNFFQKKIADRNVSDI
jgi:hypothetical protein